MYFIIFLRTHHIIFKPFIIFIIIFHTIFTYVAFMFNFYDVKFQTQVAMDRFLISTCGIYSLVYLIIYNKFKLKMIPKTYKIKKCRLCGNNKLKKYFRMETFL